MLLFVSVCLLWHMHRIAWAAHKPVSGNGSFVQRLDPLQNLFCPVDAVPLQHPLHRPEHHVRPITVARWRWWRDSRFCFPWVRQLPLQCSLFGTKGQAERKRSSDRLIELLRSNPAMCSSPSAGAALALPSTPKNAGLRNAARRRDHLCQF